MIWFWRIITGYLTIRINSENSEIFLNRVAANGINIWNLCYNDGYIYGNISPNNFLGLKKINHGLKCNIKIIQKRGLGFKIKKHKNRLGFIIGFFIFISILIILTNYIWVINIEGNNNISDSQIITSCKKLDVHTGMSKHKFDNKNIAQRLQLIQDGIAWCSFNVEGSVLSVNLSETEPSDKDERQTPSNIKSVIDGKIKKINITSGDVVVKVGDTVSKGDLLVSGITQKMSSNFFVHSNGEIIADTKRVFSAEGDFTQIKTVETGEVFTNYTVEIFKLKIPLFLGEVKKPWNYKHSVKTFKIFDKNTPIKIACEQYKTTQKIKLTYDSDILEKELYKNIQNQVDEFNFLSVVEREREVIKTSKGILLKITYDCEENIALQDEILLNKAN